MNVFVTGATGMIGRALVEALVARGDRVNALSRRDSATFPEGVQVVNGDPTLPGAWQKELKKADACVHLAGDPIVEGRWTAQKKRRLLESRTLSTANVAEVIGAGGPRVLVSASAVGIYGDRGDEVLTRKRGKPRPFTAGKDSAARASELMSEGAAK